MNRRIIIVDPHVSVREMLIIIVTQRLNLDVVADTDSGLKALELCRKHLPSLVIFELGLPELCGIELLRRVRLQGIPTRTLIYAGGVGYQQMIVTLRSKPDGFVTKHDSLATLCEAIRVVNGGGAYFSRSVGHALAASHVENETTVELTSREREVLQMVAESTSSKEIAKRLSLSVKTVDNHRMRIMEKLNLHNTAALTRFALQQGLVT